METRVGKVETGVGKRVKETGCKDEMKRKIWKVVVEP